MTHLNMNTPTPDYGEPWDFDGENWITDSHNAEIINLDSIHSKNAKRLIACVNACAGMADPAKEIEAMREAIREAHTALDGCLKYMLGVSVCNLDLECETMDDAHHALAKLQPFLK